MAEFSGFYQTVSSGAVGDQQASYTIAHWNKAVEILAACAGQQGVAARFGVRLKPYGGTNEVLIDTGAALVDKHWYYNDAVATLSIPSAVGTGNTRIDRIVLRHSDADKTVRLTRIAGTDAASPSAPAITTSAGTTYDVTVCQVTVNTAGTVTVSTDERDWAIPSYNADHFEFDPVDFFQIKQGAITATELANSAVDTDQLAAGAVTTSKLDPGAVTNDILDLQAVAAENISTGVPFLTNRQGGHATDWTGAGTTNYPVSTRVLLQAGSQELTFAAETSKEVTITFPTVYTAVPLVVVTPRSSVVIAGIVSWGNSTFRVHLAANNAASPITGTIGFNWIAFGPTA